MVNYGFPIVGRSQAETSPCQAKPFKYYLERERERDGKSLDIQRPCIEY